jgi:hypothetical protein
MADVGELVVGAWLTQVRGYDFVVYNQRPGRELPESVAPKGLAGVSARLGELDVVGLHTAEQSSYLAECTTHLGGLLIGNSPDDAVAKLRNKFLISAAYADVLNSRTGLRPSIAFWSPKISIALVQRKAQLEEAVGRPVDFVVNDVYADRVAELVDAASRTTTSTGNDFYRSLQLLTHLARSPFLDLPRKTKKQIAEVAQAALPIATQELTWSDVQQVHGTQRGIRAKRGGTSASIICNTSPHAPYPDRFIGPDVLRYVGQGRVGDQSLTGDNESLLQAIERSVPIRVFEAVGRNRFRDHGMWIGDGTPEFHIEPSTGRRLVVFTLRRLT